MLFAILRLPGIRDKLPFYFYGYAVMGCTVFNIFVTVRDIGYLEKKYGDICQFIRDTYLFTSRDIYPSPL